MQVIDTNLQNYAWTRETGPDINNPPATAYWAQNVPLGPSGNALQVTNYSTQNGAADLVTLKRPIPQLAGVTFKYLRLKCKMYIPSVFLWNLGRLETDVKTCIQKAPNSSTPIRNVVNGSTQWNRTNGIWQIDGDPPAWKNTAFTPNPPLDDWFDYYHDMQYSGTTFSVLGCGFDTQAYKTPGNMLNVPLQNTNWGDLVAAIQFQLMVFKAGTISVYYDQIALVWSDGAIQ